MSGAENSSAPRLLLVDDDAGFRAVARRLLEAGGFEVAELANGSEVLETCRRLRPELVLLDIQLPGLDGFAVAELLADEPATVVLISTRDGRAYRRRLVTTPVQAFIPKAELSVARLRRVLGPGPP